MRAALQLLLVVMALGAARPAHAQAYSQFRVTCMGTALPYPLTVHMASTKDSHVALRLDNPATYPLYVSLTEAPARAGEKLLETLSPEEAPRHPSDARRMRLLPSLTTTLAPAILPDTGGGELRIEVTADDPFGTSFNDEPEVLGRLTVTLSPTGAEGGWLMARAVDGTERVGARIVRPVRNFESAATPQEDDGRNAQHMATRVAPTLLRGAVRLGSRAGSATREAAARVASHTGRVLEWGRRAGHEAGERYSEWSRSPAGRAAQRGHVRLPVRVGRGGGPSRMASSPATWRTPLEGIDVRGSSTCA